MVAGIILILTDFKTLNRKAQSVISSTGVYREVLSFLLTIVYPLYFVSTYEMILRQFWNLCYVSVGHFYVVRVDRRG